MLCTNMPKRSGFNLYGHIKLHSAKHLIFILVFTLGNNAYGQCGRRIVEGEIYGHNPRVHKMEDIPDNIAKVNVGNQTGKRKRKGESRVHPIKSDLIKRMLSSIVTADM